MIFLFSKRELNKKAELHKTNRLLNNHKLKFSYFFPFQNQIVLESSLENG